MRFVRHRSEPIDGGLGNRSFWRALVIFQGTGPEALSALDSRDQCLTFSALNLIPLLGELGPVEPKLTFSQFFDFRFGLNSA
jgi:hypothetical protein